MSLSDSERNSRDRWVSTLWYVSMSNNRDEYTSIPSKPTTDRYGENMRVSNLARREMT